MTDRANMVDVGEAEIYTETHGEGEPLLLIAGLGGKGSFWHKQVSMLADRFSVILHDHRGVGNSSPAPVVTSSQEMAQDVLALMDAMGLESAHVVGHSTGGAIGQHMALMQPHRVKSLVLSASWPGPTQLFVDTFRTRRDILINCGVRQYMMVGSLLASPAWSIAPTYPGIDEYLKQRIETFPGLEIELARLNAVMTHDLRYRLKDITVPTGVISARDDCLTSPDMSDELATLIPGAKQVMLPEGGHFCPMTVTERYNQELSDLIDAISG
ncbi:MAG: alpha/beta fold hydrolase [Pseudomonadota bacterium]